MVDHPKKILIFLRLPRPFELNELDFHQMSFGVWILELIGSRGPDLCKLGQREDDNAKAAK